MQKALSLIIGLAFILGCVYLFLQSPISGQDTLYINGVEIQVDVVSTPTERNLGLSGRSGLEEGQGMLFIFQTPGEYGFWMKDMLFSIDIIWINEDWQVVSVEHDVSPETFPTAFYPTEPIKYVLETRAGWSSAHNIDTGDMVSSGAHF